MTGPGPTGPPPPGWQPPPSPYGPGYQPYPPPPMRLRPRVSGSVALPIAGALLILGCMLFLPWAEYGGEYTFLPELTGEAKGPGFGVGYVDNVFPYTIGFFGILYAFAANLDSRAWRWTHFGFMAVIVGL